MLNSSFRLDTGMVMFSVCSRPVNWGFGMTLTLRSAAQELRELYGADAERICMRSAEHAEKGGMPEMARDWRELAAEVERLIPAGGCPVASAS